MKNLLTVIISIIIGLVIGYFVFSSTPPAKQDHSHQGHSHAHDQMEVDAGPIPGVNLTLHKDPKSGYNAEITLTNFRLAPENASTDHVAGEGHAHIYVNGEKINRVYGKWYHLGSAKPGDEISVTLSTNNHMELTMDGAVIEAKAIAK